MPRLEELSGFDGVLDWCLGIVDFARRFRAGQTVWEDLAQPGIVISGPLGIGKTLFVRSLAASAGVGLVEASVASWFSDGSSYLDAVCKRIDADFAAARALAAKTGIALLFWNELDALPDRAGLTDRGREWWSTTISKALVACENGSRGPIVLVGATNYGTRIDCALLRPGRFERLVELRLPDRAALSGILGVHAPELAVGEREAIAPLLAGRSGAEVVALARQARAREGRGSGPRGGGPARCPPRPGRRGRRGPRGGRVPRGRARPRRARARDPRRDRINRAGRRLRRIGDGAPPDRGADARGDRGLRDRAAGRARRRRRLGPRPEFGSPRRPARRDAPHGRGPSRARTGRRARGAGARRRAGCQRLDAPLRRTIAADLARLHARAAAILDANADAHRRLVTALRAASILTGDAAREVAGALRPPTSARRDGEARS